MAMMFVEKALHMRGLDEGLRTWQRIWRALTEPLRNPYRPEQHYMRGPGPKYRAKATASKLGGSVGICQG
jgi:hypothetical protein